MDAYSEKYEPQKLLLLPDQSCLLESTASRFFGAVPVLCAKVIEISMSSFQNQNCNNFSPEDFMEANLLKQGL